MNVTQTKKGFTIIEVVLVLAIAGLIFLMVFIALPALQSGQRDTSRKQDVGSIATAVNSYIANNRNKLPAAGVSSAATLGAYTASSGKWSNYLEPVSGAITSVNVVGAVGSGNPATLTTGAAASNLKDGNAQVVFGARCGETVAGTNATQAFTRGSDRQYVVVTLLETGGGTPFCQDS